jgi:hypothetical protein
MFLEVAVIALAQTERRVRERGGLQRRVRTKARLLVGFWGSGDPS